MPTFNKLFTTILNARIKADRETISEILLPVLSINSAGKSLWSAPPTYEESSAAHLIKLQRSIRLQSKGSGVSPSLTTDYTSESLPSNSVAFHRIEGPILAERTNWFFSTAQFMDNILEADQNSNISAHFLHISSGGGDAWLLHEAHQELSSLTKPVIAFVTRRACSAAYYLASAADEIYTYTSNCVVGSIGTMVSTINIQPYFEKMGLGFIEEYATKSDLKNKKFNDLLSGKPSQYITEELDPHQEEFERDIRSSRSVLNDLKDDDPVFRGETFRANKAIENGLIDGITDIATAINRASVLGATHSNNIENRERLLSQL